MAAVEELHDDQSSLRRALDSFPHARAIEIERRIIDAADRAARTGNPKPLVDLVRLTIATAGLGESPEFRAAVAWSDAHPEPNPRPLPDGGRA